MDLKEFVLRLLNGIHPDMANWSEFDRWFARQQRGEFTVNDPIGRDIYKFAEAFLKNYDITKKVT